MTFSFQHPFVPRLLDPDWPLLVKADTSSIENSGGQDGVGDGGETICIVLFGFRRAGVDAPCGVDELFDGDISIATLSVKVAAIRGRVFHAAQRVRPDLVDDRASGRIAH